jgi:hypothetical protein
MAKKVRSFRLSDECMEMLQELVRLKQQEVEEFGALYRNVEVTPAWVIEELIAVEYEMAKKRGRI